MTILPQEPMYTALDYVVKEVIVLPEKLTIELMIEYFKSHDFWFNLRIMFEEFFTGKRRKVIGDEISEELLRTVFDYYFNFYKLIFFTWEPIENELNLIYDIELKQPSDLLKIVLANEARQWITPKKYAEAQSLYKAYKVGEICKLQKFENPANNRKFEMWLRRIEKQTGEKISETDKEFKIIDLCVEIARNTKNKKYVNDFENSIISRYKFILKNLRKEFRYRT